MPTSFSDNYQIKLIGTGLEAGTWGSSTNENFKRIEQALGGSILDFDITSPGGTSSWNSGTRTLTWYTMDTADAEDAAGNEGRYRYVVFEDGGGDVGAGGAIIDIFGSDSGDFPSRVFFVKNSLTNSREITFNAGSGSNYVLANGAQAVLYTNTADQEVGNLLSNLQVESLTAQDGELNVLSTLEVGPGTGTGTIQSQGNHSLVVQTGDASDTGAITLRSGADANLDITPDGAGGIVVPAGSIAIAGVNKVASFTSTSDPGDTNTPSAATNLSEEITKIRYALQRSNVGIGTVISEDGAGDNVGLASSWFDGCVIGENILINHAMTDQCEEIADPGGATSWMNPIGFRSGAAGSPGAGLSVKIEATSTNLPVSEGEGNVAVWTCTHLASDAGASYVYQGPFADDDAYYLVEVRTKTISGQTGASYFETTGCHDDVVIPLIDDNVYRSYSAIVQVQSPPSFKLGIRGGDSDGEVSINHVSYFSCRKVEFTLASTRISSAKPYTQTWVSNSSASCTSVNMQTVSDALTAKVRLPCSGCTVHVTLTTSFSSPGGTPAESLVRMYLIRCLNASCRGVAVAEGTPTSADTVTLNLSYSESYYDSPSDPFGNNAGDLITFYPLYVVGTDTPDFHVTSGDTFPAGGTGGSGGAVWSGSGQNQVLTMTLVTP